MTSESESSSSENQKLSSKMKPLADRFGRTVNYLRVSLTQRCNYSCFFCHHEGEQQEGPEMTLEEIENLVRAASKRGIRRVKLTGGEALLRDDLLDIVKSLAPLVDDLSLTTNGSRLEEMASELKDAGLERVNVSLHTLNPATFARITGRDNLEAVKRGIQSAVEVGLNPVKINMTILKDINENEINAMMDFACRTGTILQLIELQYMPGENDRTWQRYWVDLEAAEQQLESKASEIRKRSLHARKQYTLLLDPGEVVVEVVRPTHNSSFCDSCTRLRMTSDGRLKPCLLRHDNLIDIRALLGDENPRSSVDGALVRAVETREPYWRGEDST